MSNTAQTTATTRVPMDHRGRPRSSRCLFYLMTMVSIPTLALYGPVQSKDFITSSGTDTGALWGCFLEVIVALAGIGTAITLYRWSSGRTKAWRSASSPPAPSKPPCSSPVSPASSRS